MLEDWATVDGGGPAASRAGRIDETGTGMMGGGMMGGMMRGGMGRPRAGEPEPLRQPLYDAYSIGGRAAEGAEPLRVRQNDRVKLRIINAASSTTFVLRLAGHRLTVTHGDGRPVEPLEVDVIRVGMGERYDAEFIADNPGRWALLGAPEGGADARPLRTLLYDGVATRESSHEGPDRPRGLTYRDLVARPEDGLSAATGIDRVVRLTLSGGMMGSPYWTINGERYPDTAAIDVARGCDIDDGRADRAYGAEIEPEYVDTLREVPVEHFAPMMKLELVCYDQNVDAYVDIIREAARTGERGDGVVFVSPVDDAVRIRSGERGQQAL